MSSHSVTLPGDASSCAIARRFVVDFLEAAPEQVRDSAGLLTSEAVTNALLHAAGPIMVAVTQLDDRYRVEVRDAGRLPPTQKHYGPEDVTGRGLKMLNTLAAAWGWQPIRSGKVVWFDLTTDGSVVNGSTPSHDRREGEDPYPSGVQIALLGAPVRAMIRAGAHYDALYREFRFILELDATSRQLVPGRLLQLIDELGTQFLGFGQGPEEEWEQVVRDGRATVDLTFRLPAAAAPFVEKYEGLLDEADSYCREQRLRTVASQETLAVRRWAFGEVVRQCRGGMPVRWSGIPSMEA
jgi:anti-sigma regulatory factor (Ser/Thr protein kinase)